MAQIRAVKRYPCPRRRAATRMHALRSNAMIAVSESYDPDATNATQPKPMFGFQSLSSDCEPSGPRARHVSRPAHQNIFVALTLFGV